MTNQSQYLLLKFSNSTKIWSGLEHSLTAPIKLPCYLASVILSSYRSKVTYLSSNIEPCVIFTILENTFQNVSTLLLHNHEAPLVFIQPRKYLKKSAFFVVCDWTYNLYGAFLSSVTNSNVCH